MQFRPFELERFFATYEFKVDHLLSASDCESLSMQSLLDMADPELKNLWNDLKLGYTESMGHPLLREEVAGLYRDIRAEDVLIAAPEEAIFLAMNTLLHPGDHVIALYPAYQSLHEVARGLGCEITKWQLAPASDGWHLDLDALERSFTNRTRLIIVNFPHNPTGFLPARDQLETILEIAASRGIYVFSDEMYRFLEYDPNTTLPAACDLYERAVSLSGLSKTFALPGLRIGWLATADQELLVACSHLKDYTTICSSAPSEILGIISLRAKAAIITRSLNIIRANLDRADVFFTRHSGLFAWLRPNAGSVAFPGVSSTMPVADLSRGLLEKESVLLVPADVFQYSGNHFRLGLGRRNFPEGLARFDEYLGRIGPMV